MNREGGSNDGDAITALLATVAVCPYAPFASHSAVAAAALLAAGTAPATTGIEQVIPVRITLTDKGVAFSHRLKPTTNSTIAVQVVNSRGAPHVQARLAQDARDPARRPRELLLQLLGPRERALALAGTTGKAFHGTIHVKLAGIYNAYG